MTSSEVGESAALQANDCSLEREGIFDQFSANTTAQLYYYTVSSSSDSDGNISVIDVKRETFSSDVRIVSKCEDEIDDGYSEDDEDDNSQEEYTSESDENFHDKHTKAYGFRRRNLRDHRIEDYDTRMCESSDDSFADDPKYTPSSDDEPYDISADNWTVVRGSRRKTTDGVIRKDGSTNTRQKTGQKPNSLKIRLQTSISKEKESKLQKLKKTLRRNSATLPRKKLNSKKDKMERTDGRRPLNKSGESEEITKNDQKPLKNALNAEELVTKEEERQLELKASRDIPNVPQGLSTFPKKNPKIRFGYNSTAPKIPEIRHIRRRHLRQTPSRVAGSDKSVFNEASTSSDEEPIAIQTRAGRKVFKLTPPKTSQSNNNIAETKTSSVSFSPQSTKKMERTASCDSTTSVTSTGNGLKIVIRRQSKDQNRAGITNQEQNASNISEMSSSSSDSTGHESPEIISDEFLAPKTVISGGQTAKSAQNINMKKFAKTPSPTRDETLKRGIESSNLVECLPNNDKTKAAPKEMATTNDSCQIDQSAEGNAAEIAVKSVADDDQTKKKKHKKKRKKERGRSVSIAGTEEACNAEYTAMRLAMELPRHNWLVKHLIKEKKIKAGDDKPLNNLPETEDQNGLVSTYQTPVRRASGAENCDKQDIQAITTTPTTIPGASHSTSLIDQSETIESQEISCLEDPKSQSTSYLKSPSMVGIVKPFQHLNMSPAILKNGDFSPPPLCIVDEDESTNNTGTITPNRNPTPQLESKKMVGSIQCYSAVADTDMSNSRKSCDSGGESSPDSSKKTERDINAPSCSSSSSISKSASVDETSKETVKSDEVPIPFIKHNSDVWPVENIEGSDESKKPQEAVEKNNSSDSTAEVESEPEIKISNCFSLALDLTTKSEKTPMHAVMDEPLDLSVNSSRGDTSPKVLDLSVKKIKVEPQPPKPPQPQVSASTSINKVKVKSSTDIPMKKATPPPSVPQPQPGMDLKIPAEKKIRRIEETVKTNRNTVIVIDDETPTDEIVSGKSPNVSSTKYPKKITTNAGETSRKNDTCASTKPMKRCASHDLSLPKTDEIPKPAKLSRLSFDDSRISNNNNTTSMGIPQPVVTHHQSFNNFGNPVAIKNVRVTNPNPVPQPAVIQSVKAEPFISPSRTIPTNQPDYKPPASSELLRLQMMQSQGNVHRMVTPAAPRFNANSMPKELNNPIPRNKSPILSKTMGDISGLQRSRSVEMNKPRVNMMPAQHRSSVDGQMQLGNLQRSISVEISNARAQSVAKAYHPDIRQLEPYIKERQRAVNEEIQELEALKKHLANAKESRKDVQVVRAPLPNYNDHVKQTRQHYNPPLTATMPMRTRPAQQLVSRYPSVRPESHPIPQIAKTVSPRQMMRPVAHTTNNGLFHLAQPQAPSQWRRFPSSDPVGLTRLMMQRPPVNGNAPYTGSIVRHVNPPPQMYTDPKFSLITPTSVRMVNPPQNIPPEYVRPPTVTPTTPAIPTPRMPIQTNPCPVYRNGGLTVNNNLRTKLNEPIMIEDDMARDSFNKKRPPPPPNSTNSLRIRRAHSYHPPLSKKIDNDRATHRLMNAPVPEHSSPRQPHKLPAGPKPTEASGESCVRCRGKAFYLCSGCRQMWYCSKECQLQDWKSHSSICFG